MNGTSFEGYIRCTICTIAYPVSRVNPGYSRPKQAEPSGERLHLKDDTLYDEALKYCINCKRCEVVCPFNVEIGDITQRVRAKCDTTRPSLRNFMLSHIDLMGGVPTPLVPIVNIVTSLKLVRQLPGTALKVDHRRTLPKYSFGTFRRWYRNMAAQQAQYKDQVAFSHGCFANYNRPQLGKGLIKVLSAMGTGMQLPSEEKCYSVSLIANDFTDKAYRQAIMSVESIRETVGIKGIPVTATSPMCIFALCDEYPGMPNVDNKDLHDHIELTTHWPWRKLGESKTLPLKPLPLKAIYHTPCHMEKMGWTLYTLELSRKIPGLKLMVPDSRCCGITGTYGFREENYPTSQAIGVPLFHQIEESGTDLIVIDYETCK